MDFAFSKDQELIRKSVREFFKKECPTDTVRELKDDPRGFSPKMWKKMVKLGYPGVMIPELYGGMDGEFIELMIIMEEIGRSLAPLPLYATVGLCVPALIQFGTDSQKEDLLPDIAEKGTIWTLAHSEGATDQDAAGIQLTATSDGDYYMLSGTKLFVPFANSAKKIMVTARTQNSENREDGVSVFYLDAGAEGLTMTAMPTAAHDPRCEVVFSGVRIPRENLVGELNGGWQVVDHIFQQAAVLKAAEMSGGAQAALEMAVEYTRERKQFEKPLGSFQAVQHRLADLLTEVDGLRCLVHRAAWETNSGTPSRKMNAIVKYRANEVYHRVCYHGMVMHGAIGWTEEMDIGLYHLRTRGLISDAGESDFHLERIARELETYKPAIQTL